MAAAAPDIPGQEELPASVSRPMAIAELPWHAARFPGTEQEAPLRDEAAGLQTLPIGMAPGARLPPHEHADIEQTCVLEGSLADDEGNEVCAGNFIRRTKSRRHAARSPRGALLIGIFLKPNVLLESPSRGGAGRQRPSSSADVSTRHMLRTWSLSISKSARSPGGGLNCLSSTLSAVRRTRRFI